jgi:hypothetical protein
VPDAKENLTSVSLAVTVSGDMRFVPIVRALAVRLAQHAGRRGPDAEGVGEAVERAVTGIIRHALDRGDEIALDLAAGQGAVDIWIRFHGTAHGALERGLSLPREGDSDLEHMRRAVDHVEFGRDGTRDYCRLTHHDADGTGIV